MAKLKLAGLYTITLVLLVVILSAFWGPLPSLPRQVQGAKLSGDMLQEHKLLEDVSFLHERFKELQQPTQQQAQHGSASAEEARAAQVAFQKIMDSIERKSFSYSSVNKKKLYDIFSSFNVAINNHTVVAPASNDNQAAKLQSEVAQRNKQIADLENQLKVNSASLNEATQNVVGLQNDLKSRNNRMVELEKQLKNTPASTGVNPQDYAKVQKDLQRKNSRVTELERQLQQKSTTAASSTTSSRELEKLRSDNKYLSLALASQFKQTSDLTRLNKQLTADMERLKRRPQ